MQRFPRRTWLAPLAVLLAACATTPREPPPKPFAGTHWNAVLELPPAGEKPWVRFGDGRLEGFGGVSAHNLRPHSRGVARREAGYAARSV